ncbi:unnamed protein product [Knipowitschia caucasica]|uniref:Uncharacterized protein n=1 Tax=Knipowitschia caucasica TaxID=637954 RepID=A0AAV2JG32_KNICA
MRRQKLYSNAVRRQNKTMSRIASLPAKDAESSQKKVSRMKALEYAKTISKPLQSKTKEKRQLDSDDLTEPAPCVEGLVLSRTTSLELTSLELLRKRHEEEKLAVAMLRKIHMV